MYKIKENIIIKDNGALIIPMIVGNRDYQEYLEWVAQGGQAEILEEENSEIEQIEEVVKSAISFGNRILVEFTAENIQLGITQLEMTKRVREAMADVILALQTGSLYDAIDEVREIPDSKKDGKFISNKRLLKYVNKIEEFLNIEKSTSI